MCHPLPTSTSTLTHPLPTPHPLTHAHGHALVGLDWTGLDCQARLSACRLDSTSFSKWVMDDGWTDGRRRRRTNHEEERHQQHQKTRRRSEWIIAVCCTIHSSLAASSGPGANPSTMAPWKRQHQTGGRWLSLSHSILRSILWYAAPKDPTVWFVCLRYKSKASMCHSKSR